MLIVVSGRVVSAFLAAIALAGCSLGEDEEPEAVSGAAKQVAGTIDRLERATRAGDWAGICKDVFSKTAMERAGGRDCARLLREQAQDVRRPEIHVVSIELKGDRAQVHVRTRSAGQALAEDTVVLVRENGEWRIDSLAAG
jgi:hypothetical protein